MKATFQSKQDILRNDALKNVLAMPKTTLSQMSENHKSNFQTKIFGFFNVFAFQLNQKHVKLFESLIFNKE